MWENNALPKCIKMLERDWFTNIMIYYFSLLEGMNIFLFKQIVNNANFNI